MMLTSGGRPGDRARCLELGVASYLTKPVKQSDLLDTIANVLSARPGGRRAQPRAAPPGPLVEAARPLKVLVAEDNRVNQHVVVGMLERAGHRAAVAENGREALALLEKERFDVVLMDVQMPELDGIETTTAIRERERTGGGHLPIVAVTAHTMQGDAERCLAAGMDAYLAKPLQARELLATIDSVTGGGPLPPPAAPASGEPLDETRLLARVGGDVRALTDLIRLFRADAPKLLGRIRKAVAGRDARALQSAAHALKGAVSNFAAPAATEAAARLQKMGETGDLSEGRIALRALERELTRVNEALASLAGPAPARRGPRKKAAPRRVRRR
jgi:CheY-like chemotaxis protein/HPt (histidine-containing phosphotransfer) domain-containing protein